MVPYLAEGAEGSRGEFVLSCGTVVAAGVPPPPDSGWRGGCLNSVRVRFDDDPPECEPREQCFWEMYDVASPPGAALAAKARACARYVAPPGTMWLPHPGG